MKAGLYAAIFLCLIAALGSQSRGALLAMTSMGAVLWWRSKSRLALAVMIVVMGAVALVFMPETWMGRMNTIATYDQDASAMGRINAWTMAINIANDRILGAGFATDLPWIYQRYAPNPDFVIVAHSIYFQILGEHGYIGLFLYLGFWFLTYRLANRITKLTAGNKDLQWANMLGAMAKVSIIGFAVGGMFLSLAYWDMPFYIMVILLCTERLLGTPVTQTASVRAVADPIPEAVPTSNRPRKGSTGAIPSNNNGR
jgi:probable O-glycosylation ligase (exosortase A-associated)